jgi:hypothetical protein
VRASEERPKQRKSKNTLRKGSAQNTIGREGPFGLAAVREEMEEREERENIGSDDE